MKKNQSKTSVKRERTTDPTREERDKRLDEILKQQAERNVLQPADNERYKDFFDLNSKSTAQPRPWF